MSQSIGVLANQVSIAIVRLPLRLNQGIKPNANVNYYLEH